jgi:DNA-binding transcriptional ArsR family regulator
MAAEHSLAAIASAIAEPARARMLCALLDGRARTATELCAQSDLAASTTSAHLARLVEQKLVVCTPQGRHRYYALQGAEVADALEALLVVAGRSGEALSRAPQRLRAARTCYDHLAGSVAVALHERLLARGWLVPSQERGYVLSPHGVRGFEAWGVDVEAARTARRRFACACLDWSERRPHLGGALGAALLAAATQRRWLTRELDGRAVELTIKGWREWLQPVGVNAA